MAGKQNTLKTVVLVLFFLGAGLFIMYQLSKRQLILEENQAVDLFNAKSYDEAATAYAGLLPKLKGEDEERVRKLLAQCYKQQADNPTLTTEEQIALYRKALQYDETCIENDTLRQFVTFPAMFPGGAPEPGQQQPEFPKPEPPPSHD